VARAVLDTDVASLSYRGRLPASLAARLVGQEVCVTFVTVGELSRWAEKRRWGTRARTELVDWLGRTVVLPYDERVAWRWANSPSRRKVSIRSRPVVWAGVDLGRVPNGSKEGSGPAGEPGSSSHITGQMGGSRRSSHER